MSKTCVTFVYANMMGEWGNVKPNQTTINIFFSYLIFTGKIFVLENGFSSPFWGAVNWWRDNEPDRVKISSHRVLGQSRHDQP